MNKRIVDLSLTVCHGTPVFPLDPHTGFITHQTIETTGYNITQISMSTHVGTHLDAPRHFLKRGETVDKLNLSKCVGSAFVIDMRHKKPKEEIKISDLKPFNEKIVRGAKILIRTDWAKFFPGKKYFFESPIVTIETAKWLAKREVGLIGVEVPSINCQDWLKVHRILLSKGVVIVEALTNLCKLKKRDVFFVALPLKLKGLDGSPIRAIAIE